MNVDQLLVEIAKSIPALAALVWLMWSHNKSATAKDTAFLKHLEKRDEIFRTELAHIGDGCHAVQAEATEAIRANTHMLGKVEAKLDAALSERGGG